MKHLLIKITLCVNKNPLQRLKIAYNDIAFNIVQFFNYTDSKLPQLIGLYIRYTYKVLLVLISDPIPL